MAWERQKCIFAMRMRLWIAAFLISLFAFQVLPLTALGKPCNKAKIAAGETPAEDGADDESAVPEAGKLKKDGPPTEDYYLTPGAQRFSPFQTALIRTTVSPERTVTAATGHARLHTPPPDCC